MGSLDQLYQQVILDHYKEKHGFGMPEPAAGLLLADSYQKNPLCGDEITLRVAVERAAGKDVVREVSWVGDGCSISQASASVLHDLMVDLPTGEVDELVEAFRTMVRSRGSVEPDEELLGDAVAFAGVGRHANRVKCAMLGWIAFEDALYRAVADGTAANGPAPGAARTRPEDSPARSLDVEEERS